MIFSAINVTFSAIFRSDCFFLFLRSCRPGDGRLSVTFSVINVIFSAILRNDCSLLCPCRPGVGWLSMTFSAVNVTFSATLRGLLRSGCIRSGLCVSGLGWEHGIFVGILQFITVLLLVVCLDFVCCLSNLVQEF